MVGGAGGVVTGVRINRLAAFAGLLLLGAAAGCWALRAGGGELGEAAAPLATGSADSTAVPDDADPAGRDALLGGPQLEWTPLEFVEVVVPDAFDPIVAGEDLPPGFRQLLNRDDILPVYEPVFLESGEVGWPDDEMVLGLVIDGEARAYPISYLNVREMVVDSVAGVPVLVSWCPLCGTAMVHDRRLGDTVLVLGNQGALWGNAMTWWDHDTGSVWSQPLGEAILGPRKGATLDLLPSMLTTWRSWRVEHPGTLALRAPEGRAFRAGVSLDDTAIVVRFGADTAVFPVALLREVGVVNEVVGGAPVAVVIDPEDPDRWAVLSRTLDDRVVVLEVRDGALVDVETGTVWDAARGIALEGPLRGEVLGLLPGFTSFQKDVATFWPEARVWSPGG
jgi:hypothetical protein